MWDSDPVLPVGGAAAASPTGQHGLEIVMAVAEGWTSAEAVGKCVIAGIALQGSRLVPGLDTPPW